MSGLAGWVDPRRDLEREAAVLHAMTESLRARGPDGGGVWLSPAAALGHRGRGASALDPQAGAQPLVVDGGRGPVVAMLSGHVNNAADLRRELGGAWRTRADAEILARAYLCWGDALAEHLEGAFAFALWDASSRKLLLGRDRFGVKPLYYAVLDGGVLFGSEPKALLAHPSFRPRLEPGAIPMLLQPRLARPGETPLRGMHEVPPAHVVAYTTSGLTRRRYWSLTSAPHRDSFEDTARTVRALLEDAVRRELADDGPGGAMLSGGLDSTSVAALALQALRARAAGETLDTFCIRFESDATHFVATELRPDIDAPYAAAAAEHLGSRHRTLSVSVAELAQVVPATRRARDLPGWGQFDASMFILFREMRRHCQVALTGEAADEIFGGYPYFFDRELVERGHFPWLGNAPRLAEYLSPEFARALDPQADERARYAELVAQVPRLDGEDAHDARLREAFYLGLCGPLSVILDRKDRMSAAHGLEVRIPFCDRRLVEYVWNVPWALKSRGGVKGLLKAAVADLLPPSTLERKKSAYPHVQSPEYDRALAAEALRIVSDPRSAVAALVDVPRLTELIRELCAGTPEGRAARRFPGGASPVYMLIHLVELQRWIEEYEVSC